MITAVMLDSREPESIQTLTFGNVPKVVTALDAGDLWVSCSDGTLVIVERKTPNDLLSSIGDNRLFLQAQKMRQRSAWCYVVVTGTITPSHDGKTIVNGRVQGWNWDSVQGALLSVQEAGVNVVYCDHDNAYERTVQWLCNRNHGEKVVPPTPAVRVMSPGEVILTSLPSIGLTHAQEVLEYWDGNAARGLCWLTWDTFGDVAGIGPGIKANVRRALGLKDGETLTVWSDEALEYSRQFQQEKVTA